MSRKNTIILALLIAAVIGGLVGFLYVFRTSESSVESSKTDIKIDAPNLVLAFEDNEQDANALYLDKIVQVTGIIAETSEDNLFITVTLKNPEDASGVMCSFDKTTVDKSVLNAGGRITVKGLCTGYLIDVVLTKCTIVSRY